MVVDFHRLIRKPDGSLDRPLLTLMNPDQTIVGPIGHYFDLKPVLKFNEVSELTFSVPREVDGEPVWYYDRLTGGMLVEVEGVGVFILNNPSSENSSAQEIKECSAKSREFELSKKRVVFGAGTYPFWNPVTKSNTFLGMCFEGVRGWSIGSVSPSLYDKYRTFDDYDGSLLDLCLNTAQKSFGCVFNFDTKNRVVNVVEASDNTDIVPIYLSFKNLIESNSIKENDDDMATNISVYGADGVDIRDVNPTGSNTIVHLGYAISQGQIKDDLKDKYISWKNEIIANQPHYTGLVALRNAASARYIAEAAKLTDLKGELTSLDNLRDVNIKGKSMATKTDPESEYGTVAYFEARLKEIAQQYAEKEEEIANQESLLEQIQKEYDGYVSSIQDVNNQLKMESYFTKSELDSLSPFLLDGNFTDSTFATFDVDISSSEDSYAKTEQLTATFDVGSLTDVQDTGDHRILMISGGDMSLSGQDIAGESSVVSAIVEIVSSSEAVVSIYLGSCTINEKTHPSGNMTITGSGSINVDSILSAMEQHVETTSDKETGVSHDTIWYSGSLSISLSSAALYFTRNVTEFQKYNVKQELYDYALDRIEEIAYPVYEFDISSGNFLWEKSFKQFQDNLKLGSSVYLQLTETILLHPVLLEVHFNFDDPEEFDLVFSNQFQTNRPDKVNSLKNILDKAQNTSYTLDVKQFEYSADRLSGAAEAFDNFMKNGLNAAYQQVTAGTNNQVIIDGAGIKVKDPDSKEFFTIGSNMIALVDPDNETARMALGHFYSQEYEMDYYGIVADVIFGTLIAGKGLSIACQDVNDGSMLFEANSKGVQIHNGRFYIDHDRGGQIALDPTYGFAIGTKELYQFDDDGRVVLNTENANLYIDLEGNLHIKGTLDAVDGHFSGDITGSTGTFSGIVQAEDFLDQSGNSMMTNGKFDSNYLDLGNIQLDGDTGDITMTGNLNLSGLSSITWGSLTPVKYQFSVSASGPWHSDMRETDFWRRDSTDGGKTWGTPYQFRGQDGEAVDLPFYIQSTYIDSTEIRSPEITGGTLTGGKVIGGSFHDLEELCELYMSSSGGAGSLYSSVIFSSPAGTIINFTGRIVSSSSSSYCTISSSYEIRPSGDWNFSDASVSGLYLTFS